MMRPEDFVEMEEIQNEGRLEVKLELVQREPVRALRYDATSSTESQTLKNGMASESLSNSACEIEGVP